jgi:hypothetical protein
MNDSGLWKRGLLLLVLVAIIAGVAGFLLWRQTAPQPRGEEPICPDLFAQSLYSPAAAPIAPFPATVNWGVLGQVVQSSPSPSGWKIRYAAALTLARKGQALLPFDTLCEMLNERQQQLNRSVCSKEMRMVPSEADAGRTVLNALEAISEWYRHPDRPKKFDPENADLREKYDAGLEKLTRSVEQLTQSANQVLRTEALKTLQTLRGQ